MWNQIVVGVDGSEGSARAVAAATEIAKSVSASIVFCHIEEVIPARGGGVPLRVGQEEARSSIEAAAAEMRGQGIKVEVVERTIAHAGPAGAIVDVAEDHDADLIVVGTRGYSGILGIALGSVTQRLLHLATCPILCVPDPGTDD